MVHPELIPSMNTPEMQKVAEWKNYVNQATAPRLHAMMAKIDAKGSYESDKLKNWWIDLVKKALHARIRPEVLVTRIERFLVYIGDNNNQHFIGVNPVNVVFQSNPSDFFKIIEHHGTPLALSWAWFCHYGVLAQKYRTDNPALAKEYAVAMRHYATQIQNNQ